MNIDRQIVARALDKAGQEPLTDAEIKDKTSTRWRLVIDYYHSTILETLYKTQWTSQMKRAKLELTEEENLTTYSYAYLLPIDCAKPVALNSKIDYEIEDGTLYTEDSDPILSYVSNGFTGKLVYAVADPQPTTLDKSYYYYDEDAGEYVKAESIESGVTYYVVEDQDYNFYKDYEFDPLLSKYIETMLAAKMVLKLTGSVDQYRLLYNEAILTEQEATKATFAHAHNKDKGHKYWGEILGMPDYEGEYGYVNNELL